MTQPHGENPVVGTEKREGKFQWRLQSALGCDKLKKKEEKKACVLPESFS